MGRSRDARPGQRGPLKALLQLLAIADEPDDDDDLRRRKRAGVVAGYVTIFAPLSLPLQGGQLGLSWPLAIGLSVFSLVNLVVLSRTRAFARFVVLLIIAGVVFVPAATFVGGGITGSSAGLVWGFLIPAYAILALGPRSATRWFLVYLGVVAFMVAVDPIARQIIGEPSYELRLFGQLENSVVPLAVIFLLLRYTDTRRLAAEARVDELLTNAIPASIATRLKRGEQRIAEAYPATTVVFVDIAGFTPWAQRTDPAVVVSLLDDLFSRFDAVAAEHGIEKIKTVGDAYMAAAGAPLPRDDHAQAAVEFGRAILSEVAAWRQANNLPLEVRIGLASGGVVGGVIGSRRILFDLWGDTVNIAARMESSGVPGRIHLASSTRELLEGSNSFEERRIEIKGLGPMTTFLLADPPGGQGRRSD
jgi:adenylate cyclase